MGKGFPFPEHVPLGYATKEYQSVSMQQVDDTYVYMGEVQSWYNNSPLVEYTTEVDTMVTDAVSGIGSPGQRITFEVEQITFAGTTRQHHMFGYVGHCLTVPWNQSGRYIVSMRTDFYTRLPNPGETADIVIIDTSNGYEVTPVDTTRAWNLQKGTMLCWNPNAPETQFFFNDRDPVTEDIFTVLYDISNMERIREYRFGPGPSTIANTGVAPDGSNFAAVNHGRNSWRKVVSYAGATDETLRGPGA
jgi:hypothetical protein